MQLPEIYHVKMAALKTLRAITLDRHTKLKAIVEHAGVGLYHGLIPKMTRAAINSLLDGTYKRDAQDLTSYIVALFTFVSYLASNEIGCQALNKCGMMEHLLKAIKEANLSDDDLFVGCFACLDLGY